MRIRNLIGGAAAVLGTASAALTLSLPASSHAAAYGPTGGLQPCTATSITCKSDTPPPVPGWPIHAKLTAALGIPAFDVNGATFTTHGHVFVNENLTWQGRPETVTGVQHYPGGSTVFQLFPHLPKAQNGHHVLLLP